MSVGTVSAFRLPSPARARRALELTGTSPWRLVRTAGLATAATLFQLVSLALFLPLARALLGESASGGRLGRLLPDGFLEGGDPGARIQILVALILAATAGRVACGYWAATLIARERALAQSRLSAQVVRRFLGFGQAYYDQRSVKRSADIVQRLPGQVARSVEVLHDALVSIASLALLFAALLLLSWPLAIAAIAALFVYHALYDRAVERLEEMSEELEDAEEESGVLTHDMLANLPLVHGHQGRELEAERHAIRAASLARLRIAQERLLGVLDPLRDSTAVLLLLAFAWLIAALPQAHAAAGVTRYLVFLLVLRRALSAASRLLRFPQRWRRQERALQRVAELDDGAATFVVPSGVRPFTGLRDAIVADRLSFGYPGGGEVLHELSVRFAAGRRTWVVGASGSGKSTLLRLLIRLYDCAPGTIRLDGLDLRELATPSWLDRVAWAPSEPLFFAESVRSNLTYGLERPDENELWRLADTLEIGDLLRGLPAGLDTDLGERGQRFSSGERQRLALVRLFLRRPEILLIDEATAGLDATTERKVLESLERLTTGRTVIMVAHRLSSLPPHEEVVVMRDGRAVEQGLRDDLLGKKSELAKLWSAQGLPLPSTVASA